MSNGANVRVCCRFRPLNSKEKNAGSTNICTVDEGTTLKIKSCSKPYTFDRVFDTNTAQSEVYQYAAEPFVPEVMAGFNATIFAYGQTGSGKTWTMMGNPKSEATKGIIPRLVGSIFQGIEEADSSLEFTMKLSYVEIYMEKIRDLLAADKTNLKIRESNKGVWIEDATEEFVADYEHVMETMLIGQNNRAIASTNMNMESSRSHSVFILTLGQTHKETGSNKKSKLVLVDLAGSEKVGKTGAEGHTLNEAKHINKSLSALGNVINALTKSGGSSHIPYRDSKLTRLLSDSLGGNSKTCLIITCSPSSCNLEETLSTCRFGNRAKNIKNKPKVNQEKSVAEYKRLLNAAHRTIKSQEKKINSLISAKKTLLGLLEKNKIPIPEMNVFEEKKNKKNPIENEPRNDMSNMLENPEFMNRTNFDIKSPNLNGEISKEIQILKEDKINLKKQLDEQQKRSTEEMSSSRKRLESKVKQAEELCVKLEYISLELEAKETMNQLLEKKMVGMSKEKQLAFRQLSTMEQKLNVNEMLLKQEKRKKARAVKERDNAVKQLSDNNLDLIVDSEDTESSDDDNEAENPFQQLIGQLQLQESIDRTENGVTGIQYELVLKTLEEKDKEFQERDKEFQEIKKAYQNSKDQIALLHKTITGKHSQIEKLKEVENQNKKVINKKDAQNRKLAERLEASQKLLGIVFNAKKKRNDNKKIKKPKVIQGGQRTRHPGNVRTFRSCRPQTRPQQRQSMSKSTV